ncbi:MAG: hypothetical protein KME27_07380 [Lyngbya sp. HA4199-MV5]|jgi:hypothetical protein|nr:hypothetical protein [Lyngbya sp. HA4199-MV5]
MSLKELKEEVFKLSISDRLELVSAIVLSLQTATDVEDWKYLVSRPHVWRKQLYVKGRKLLASNVWQDMIVNGMTPEQAAENWDLPLAVISEVIRYCDTHQELLRLEASEERYRLDSKGVEVESTTAA